MTPLVSILIPAYNIQPWIADTIRSALAQTWPQKEIIVINDGSTDQTLQVAQQFASANVSVVSQENQGVSAARNKAFELCQGDYIQWLDGDDLLSPDKIARQMEVADQCQSKRTLFSSAWAYFMYRVARARFSPTRLWCDLSPVEWLLRAWEGNLHMNPATWLVSRELTETAGPWDTRIVSDGEYCCRVILASDGIRFAPGAKVFYRITGASRASYIGRSTKKMEAQFLGMQLQIGHLRAREDSQRTRAACVKFLQNWLYQFYPDRPDIVKQAQELALVLGGQLEAPRLSWKYAWIRKLFGWTATKRTQQCYNRYRSSLLRFWDKLLFRLERPQLDN